MREGLPAPTGRSRSHRAADGKGRQILATHDIVTFIATTDLARARPFYADALGLTLLAEDSYACTFDTDGTTLRVTLVEKAAVAPYTVFGWSVPDIDLVIRSLNDTGVVFERFEGMEQSDLGVWTAPNCSQVAWFKDPDGNTLSVTQDPT